MYIAQTKAKNGINIVDDKKRYFVSWQDLDKLKAGTFSNQKNQPIITVQPFPEKA